MKGQTKEPERTETRASKRPEEMSLTELRVFMKREAGKLELNAPFDDNAKWALHWIEKPIADFADTWRDLLKSNINATAAFTEIRKVSGAYADVNGVEAIVIPVGYEGPTMADILDWRFREYALIEFAKKRDLARVAETIDTRKLAKEKRASDVTY